MMSQILKFIDSLKHKNLNILGAKLGVILGQNCVWLSDAALDDFFFFRSSRPEMLCKKGVIRNFAKFTGKQPSQRLFFNKVTGLRPVTLLKKSLWHRFFLVGFSKFLRQPFLNRRTLVDASVFSKICFIKSSAYALWT